MNDSFTGLVTRVARIVRKHRLFQPGDTLIVALSGGADSTALLHLLTGLPDYSPRLVAAHLNHCLRGPESDADEEFCRELAHRYAIPFESRHIDVAELASRQGLNLEDAGRRARIAFFDQVREQWHAAAVVLGHHADDQAETVLMRLLRGAGPDGLTGMPYRNERGYIRPLLEITRPEIESWLTQLGLTWREDASNRDIAFLRNRIRHELLPLLEQYNPAVRSRLASTAALLADEDDLLKQLTEELGERACTIEEGDETLACNIGTLAEQHPALRRRLLRQLLKRLAGSLDHFSNRHIAALEHLLDSPRPNATLNLPQGVTAVREYGSLLLRRTSITPPPAGCEVVVSGPGRHPLPGGGSLIVTIDPAPTDYTALSFNNACFDPDKAPFPWLVRTFNNGDRIVPLGMNGSKKVKDLFIDAKIPLFQRRRIPLVFSNKTLIWVCGLRTSQLARCEGTSIPIIRAFFSET